MLKDNNLLNSLQRFIEHASDPIWTAESTYIAHNVTSGLFHYRTFNELSRRLEGATLIFEAEWLGEGTSMQDVSRDFFAAYGLFAEQSQFIECTCQQDAIVFRIASGRTGSHAHGHLVEIRLVGKQVDRVLEGLPNQYWE